MEHIPSLLLGKSNFTSVGKKILSLQLLSNHEHLSTKSAKIQHINQTTKKHNRFFGNFVQKWANTTIINKKEGEKAGPRLGILPTTLVAFAFFQILAISAIVLINRARTNIGYITLATIGTILSYLIRKEELGIRDKVTTKVCGAISQEQLRCSNVINSREGKIFGVISLVDTSLLFYISKNLQKPMINY